MERSEMGQIIRATEQAMRMARRLDSIDPSTGRPWVRSRDMNYLPGTEANGETGYTYTVRVKTVDASADGRDSLMVVVRSDRIMSGDEVRARAILAVQSGSATTRYRYPTANPTQVREGGVEIVSVYRGQLNASDRL